MAKLLGKLKPAFLAQAKIELEASLIYESASQWYSYKHLTGIAAKLRAESDGELAHFRSLLDYVTMRGDTLNIDSPKIEP